MKFQDILYEFEIKKNNPHFNDRRIQRCFGQDYFDVIASVKKSKLNDPVKVLGVFKIPVEAKTRIKTVLDELEKPYYWAEHGTLFIVELYNYHLDKQYITFFGKKEEEIYNNRARLNMNVELRERPMSDELETPQNLSRGYYLVCHIYDNFLITMFLSRTSNKESLISRAKLRSSKYNVVFIHDPFTELDAYIDKDRAIEYEKLQKQSSTEEPKIIEPQLSDDEKRKLAYKERMKKEFERQKKLWKKR